MSLSGAWLLRTAQAWLVLDLTGSPAALGAVAVAQGLPVTVIALFAGVAIDRWGARRLTLAAQLANSISTALMAFLVLSGQVQYWEVLAFAATLGIAAALEVPSRSTIVGDLVEPKLLGEGLAMFASVNSAARILGPGVGGVIISQFGSGLCFVLTSLGYLCSLIALLLLRTDRLYPRTLARREPVLSQLVGGLKHAFSTPTLAFTMILSAFIGTFAYNWGTTLPLFARYALEGGADALGVLNMAMGVGATVGGVLLARRASPSPRLVLGAATLLSILLLVLSRSPSAVVAVVLMVGVGLASVAFDASASTLLQRQADPAFRGRVVALYTFLMVGTTPFGATITSVVASAFEIRAAVALNGSLCLLGAAVAALFLRRGSRVSP